MAGAVGSVDAAIRGTTTHQPRTRAPGRRRRPHRARHRAGRNRHRLLRLARTGRDHRIAPGRPEQGGNRMSATAPTATSRLVGRERELVAAGERHRRRRRRGEPRPRRARRDRHRQERAARRAARAGPRPPGLLVLDGRAAEHERDVPFGLVVDALDDHVAGTAPAPRGVGRRRPGRRPAVRRHVDRPPRPPRPAPASASAAIARSAPCSRCSAASAPSRCCSTTSTGPTTPRSSSSSTCCAAPRGRRTSSSSRSARWSPLPGSCTRRAPPRAAS